MSANVEYLLREILAELKIISNKLSKDDVSGRPHDRLNIQDEISKVRSKVNKEIYGPDKSSGSNGSFPKERK